MKLILALFGAGLVGTVASASEVVTYAYDAKGRLVRVQHTGGPNSGLDAQYTYDKADNRQHVSVIGGSGNGGGTQPGDPLPPIDPPPFDPPPLDPGPWVPPNPGDCYMIGQFIVCS